MLFHGPGQGLLKRQPGWRLAGDAQRRPVERMQDPLECGGAGCVGSGSRADSSDGAEGARRLRATSAVYMAS